MIYGYIRVSTVQQDTEKQKFELFNLAHSKTMTVVSAGKRCVISLNDTDRERESVIDNLIKTSIK